MARSSRTQQRQRRRTATKSAAVARRVQNADIGVEFKPSLDPPSWAGAPWWPLTVVAIATKAAPFSFEVIHALVLKSLSLDGFVKGTSNVEFNIRVLTVRVWGNNKQPITLDVYSNTSSGCRKMKQLNDRGSFMHLSHLAWRYGKSSYAMLETGCSSMKTDVFSIDGQLSDTNTATVYIQLLIQRSGIGAAQALRLCDDASSEPTSMFGFLKI